MTAPCLDLKYTPAKVYFLWQAFFVTENPERKEPRIFTDQTQISEMSVFHPCFNCGFSLFPISTGDQLAARNAGAQQQAATMHNPFHQIANERRRAGRGAGSARTCLFKCTHRGRECQENHNRLCPCLRDLLPIVVVRFCNSPGRRAAEAGVLVSAGSLLWHGLPEYRVPQYQVPGTPILPLLEAWWFNPRSVPVVSRFGV